VPVGLLAFVAWLICFTSPQTLPARARPPTDFNTAARKHAFHSAASLYLPAA
jgi:hypothetical protein